MLIDDNIHLYENPFLNPPSLEKTAEFWKAPFLGLYVPLTYTAWAVESQVGKPSKNADSNGPAPWVFHVTSLTVHFLNAILVLLILHLLCESVAASFLGAAFFALHPLQTEAVAWASAQKDLFSAFFALISVLFFLKYAKASLQKQKRPRFYFSSLISFVAALLCKPSVVTLGLMIFAMDVGWLRRPWKVSLKSLVPWFLAAVPFLLLTKFLQPDSHMGHLAAWWTRPIIAFDTVGFYLAKLLSPIHLCPDYSRNPETLLKTPSVYFSWLVPLLLGGMLYRRFPRILWLGIFFVAGILPVIGLVPFYFQIFSTVADRYVYLSLVAPALFLATVLSRSSLRAKQYGLALIILVLAPLSYFQADNWKNSIHLFVHTLTVNPGSLLAHNNLGTLMEGYGRWDDAYFHYEQSSRIAPDAVPPIYNMARVNAIRQRYPEAKSLFLKVLDHNPDIFEAHQALGKIYEKEGNLKLSKEHLARAQEIRTDPKRYDGG